MTTTEFNLQLINMESSLVKFAYQFVLNKPDVKDLVQETCLKVLLGRDKYIDNLNFKSWVFTIMKNAYINEYRRKYRKNKCFDKTKELISLSNKIAAGTDDPEAVYSASEIDRNISLLDDTFLIPFNMHLNGYKYKEIAEELGMKVGTVKSRIFFSRKKLMAQLNR